jgi:hypothetical protein
MRGVGTNFWLCTNVLLRNFYTSQNKLPIFSMSPKLDPKVDEVKADEDNDDDDEPSEPMPLDNVPVNCGFFNGWRTSYTLSGDGTDARTAYLVKAASMLPIDTLGATRHTAGPKPASKQAKADRQQKRLQYWAALGKLVD